MTDQFERVSEQVLFFHGEKEDWDGEIEDRQRTLR